jgi:hypothetical protein
VATQAELLALAQEALAAALTKYRDFMEETGYHPDHSAEGVSVQWGAYASQLLDQVEKARELVRMLGGAWEHRSVGRTW